MRRIAVLCLSVPLLCGLAATSADAQVNATPDVSVGYGILRDVTSDESITDPYPGWAVSGSYPFGWRRLSLAGEISSHTRDNVVDETQRISAFLGGARIALTRSSRFATFAQLLAGVERFSEPGFDESGAAVEPGAGLDVRLWSRLGARVQAGLRFANQGDTTYREARVLVGAVFDLGTRQP